VITVSQLSNNSKLNDSGDSSLGNILFRIASIIGIATKNGYEYGFPEWKHQEYFINPLPSVNTNSKYPVYQIKKNMYGADVGFTGFDIPDNVEISGYLGSYKYFNHCKDLIKYYLTPKDIGKYIDFDFDEYVIIHYRDYPGGNHSTWHYLTTSYYAKALELFPNKKILVVTDNISSAKNILKLNCEYLSQSIIEDFYILSKAKNLIMANSTFSWWGSYLSEAKTVAPSLWFRDNTVNTKYIIPDVYFSEWTLI
jgi:hypothetical protein